MKGTSLLQPVGMNQGMSMKEWKTEKISWRTCTMKRKSRSLWRKGTCLGMEKSLMKRKPSRGRSPMRSSRK